eukprot:CAMPEP_0197190380 /NCGR_PEP_ID=MMETSP1423-20130617/21540_1 /TAXON_ID=476441 /ORGANISM="Pseudo-nitzschia heimii, Strain UNC1101" /LENGTH=545 /DNA_ID=CAMNT_0042642749 /DNA_START=66 /DNA_END=1703 /DNA_ORIENTATION=+
MRIPATVGGYKSVATAAFMVLATLTLSMFPTNAGDVESIEAEADVLGCGDIIMLEDFSGPKHQWEEMNDPVMGGKSTGDFVVDEKEHVGAFHGSVEIVDFLNAPGFIKAETKKGETWPDVSTCTGFQFTIKSETPGYEGFRVSFGSKRPPDAFPYSYGFKANLHLDEESHDGFQSYRIPFDQFTDKWDAGTGDAVVTCAENKEYCPDEASLKDLYSVAVWGEGVEGDVDLKIQSISAYGCSGGCPTGDDFINGVAPDDDSVEDLTAAEPANSPEVVSGSPPDVIALEDFSSPVNDWTTMNDPVMGGQSTSSLSIEADDGYARFSGTCAIVPFLRAPGFVTMVTGRYGSGSFPDVSTCQGLTISMRTDVEYDGFYVSFGTDRAPGGRYAMGYKSHFELAPGDGFVETRLPFAEFSDRWDDATGKTIVACEDDPRFCPSLDTLRDMKTMSLWGEGVEGTFVLDVERIEAYGCAPGAPGDEDRFVPSTGTAASLVVAGRTMGLLVWWRVIGIVVVVGFGAKWIKNRLGTKTVPISEKGYETVSSGSLV